MSGDADSGGQGVNELPTRRSLREGGQPPPPAEEATPRLEPFVASSFPAHPPLECDVVMKGGITSGVIYPLAVCQLATVYRLRSVGGSSAGAIAAAAAAAAEIGRATLARAAEEGSQVDSASTEIGFLGLSRLSSELTEEQADGKSLLFHLFRPQPQAKRAFSLLTSALDSASRMPKPATGAAKAGLGGRLLWSGARAFPLAAAIGALAGVLLAILAVITLTGAANPWAVAASIVVLLIALILVVIGVVIGVGWGLVTDVGGLGDAGFGLSAAMGETESDLALTPWLHGKLQRLAGRAETDAALTFADLERERLDLRLMTTNLSRNQPIAMPWNDSIYFFDPEEFRKLFPAAVVQQMVDNPPPLPTGREEAFRATVLRTLAGGLRPFPLAADLPIVVATRMSLSFPLLITAVPLYAVDFALPENIEYTKRLGEWRDAHPDGTAAAAAKDVPPPDFDVNWFSDGGLTANIPVHFFDSPLPSRPTFAIDLAKFSSGRGREPDESKNVYLPDKNLGGLHRRTSHWGDKGSMARLGAFGLSLIKTARVWVDERQMVMPGYRDRIVTVYQDRDEGGLNLSMSNEVVERLSERGRHAAMRLVDRFAGDQPGVSPARGWDNHRWIRFRAATGALGEWLIAFERGYSNRSAPATDYDTMLSDDKAQPSYKITGDERQSIAKERIKALRTGIDEWSQPPVDVFSRKGPSPAPSLRVVPADQRSTDD